MFEIKRVESINEINGMREHYINSLPYSQEHFIEVKVKKCMYYIIVKNSDIIGYFCVDAEKVLFEFYLDNSALIHGQEVFCLLIDKRYIVSAECKTFDYLLMSLCLDFHKKTSCTGYLYRDYTEVEYSLLGYDDLCFRMAEKEDYSNVLEISGDFFDELEENISRREIFVLFSKNNILAAGLCMRILPGKDCYDIGMVVAEMHRNKGVGRFIICKLKEYCIDNNFIPICGCWYYNHASKKALEKSGFISKHRIIRFDF